MNKARQLFHRFSHLPLFVAFLALLWVVVGAIWQIWVPGSTAQAQGSGQNTFTLPFSIAIPGPSHAQRYVTIPNANQIGDTVSYQWKAGAGGCKVNGADVGTSLFYLEGSNDNVVWYVLAGSLDMHQAATGSGTFYNNGYFTFRRLSFPACSDTVGGVGIVPAITGLYSGYGAAIPFSDAFQLPTTAQVKAPTALGPNGFYLVQGFQCYNPNATLAYLAFANAIIPIAGSSQYNYTGPFLLGAAATTFAAYTDFALTTQVTTALPCTFDFNPSGPFYPANPVIAY